MRILVLLHWLLRVQMVLGLVQFFGPYIGFFWPPYVWAAHRIIALVAPTMAIVGFRRDAWKGAGQAATRGRPGLRVAARFALLAPLALGLCFSAGVLGGRGWAAAHIGLAGAAFLVIERATIALRRTRAATTGDPERPDGPSAVAEPSV